MANGNFGRSRTPISGEAEQSFRLMPNTHFGWCRTARAAEADSLGQRLGRSQWRRGRPRRHV